MSRVWRGRGVSLPRRFGKTTQDSGVLLDWVAHWMTKGLTYGVRSDRVSWGEGDRLKQGA